MCATTIDATLNGRKSEPPALRWDCQRYAKGQRVLGVGMESAVPSRFVLEFDWRGLRSDEDTWSGSKVNRVIGEFLGQALPSVHFAHSDLTGASKGATERV